MEVTVYGPLRGATGEKTVHVDFDGETVADAVASFVRAYPRAERHLYRDDGSLEPSVRVSVNGAAVELDADCPPDAAVSLHPAMQGG